MTSAPGLGWLPHMPSPMEGCWYLDNHWDPQLGERTPTGELLYDAKTYGGKFGSPAAARALAEQMGVVASGMRSTGSFSFDDVDVVVPVPANPPRIPYNLPDLLAERVASRLGRPFRLNGVIKTRPTGEAKHRRPVSPTAFQTNLSTRGAVVLIVDDVVLSGGTLAAVGSVLRAAGAARLGGFVATRAKKGLML